MWMGPMRIIEPVAGRSESRQVKRSDQARSADQLALLPRLPASPLPILDERQRGTRFIRWPARAVLNSPATTGMGFWSINPYVGCEFGCSYCYARDTHRYAVERATDPLSLNGGEEMMNHLSGGPLSSFSERGSGGATSSPSPVTERGSGGEVWEAFERQILVKIGAPDVLAKTLDPAKLAGSSLVIGTATDPYQPAERKFRLTRRILETLLQYRGLSIGIITKSPLVTRDLRLLQQLSLRHEVTVNISLATADAMLARRLERRSPVPKARLRALRRLVEGGIHTGLLVAPILPAINDDREGLSSLFAAGRVAGAHYAVGSALRMGPAIEHPFFEMMAREFPHLVERYKKHFKESNYVTREYQEALDRRIRSLQEEHGYPIPESIRRRQQLEGRLRRKPESQEQTSLL
jgi:DNA repair photolyase